MVDGRIDVRVEAVFPGIGILPGRLWFALDQRDLYDRLDALEAVFPRHDEPDRRAVLVGQCLAVETDGEDGQRMARLVQAKPLHIGPFERLEKPGLRSEGRRVGKEGV